jgi:hypothetical protein
MVSANTCSGQTACRYCRPMPIIKCSTVLTARQVAYHMSLSGIRIEPQAMTGCQAEQHNLVHGTQLSHCRLIASFHMQCSAYQLCVPL